MGVEYKFITGLWCPVIHCDQCDNLIEDVRLAMAAWNDPSTDSFEVTRFTPVFVHKGSCLDAFEAGLSNRHDLLTEELQDFLQHLSANVNIEGRKRRS
jgi:hypothetical protein